MEYEKWNTKYEIWIMKHKIWNMKYGKWNMKYEKWNMKYDKWNLNKVDLWRIKYEIFQGSRVLEFSSSVVL